MNKTGDVPFQSCHGRKSVYDIRSLGDDIEKPLLIFCHGFKGFKDWGHFNLIADSFARKGLIVLKFNFTYNGGTVNDPIDFPDLEAFGANNYMKEVEDLNFMIRLCAQGKIPLENWNGDVYLLGHSRGGGIVTLVGAQNPLVKKVVSWAGISDCISRLPQDQELEGWRISGVRYIINGRTNQRMPMYYQFVESLMRNKEKLSIMTASQNMEKPHLLVHGDSDLAVSHTEALSIKKWNPQAELSLIENANHVFGGKHPWEQKFLPDSTLQAVQKTSHFLMD